MEHARNHKPSRLLTLACAALGVWGWILLGPLYLRTLRPPTTEVTDFYQDWGSVRNRQVGLPVYAPHSQSIPRHLGLPRNPVESIEYNAHPPGAVLLVWPLGSINYRDALLVWDLASLAAFLASLVIVAVALPAPRAWFWPTWAFLPFCQPLYANLQLGQLTLLLLLLTTAAWALDRADRTIAAGTLIGTAAAIKLFPAYLLVYFVARGRFRVIIAAALAFAACNAVATALLGTDAFRDYIHIVLPKMEVFRGFGYNLSITGFWHKLFDPIGEQGWIPPLWPSPTVAKAGTLISILLMTAITAFVTYKARTTHERDLAFSATATAMLLATPVTWVSSLVLLLVPLAALAQSTARPGAISAPMLAVVMMILAIPQQTWTYLTLGDHLMPVTPLFVLGPASIKFYALIIIFTILAATTIHPKVRPTETQTPNSANPDAKPQSLAIQNFTHKTQRDSASKEMTSTTQARIA